jgi:hypothetical protein
MINFLRQLVVAVVLVAEIKDDVAEIKEQLISIQVRLGILEKHPPGPN